MSECPVGACDEENNFKIFDDPDSVEDEEAAEETPAAKTPVSLLHEMYTRRGQTPKYDLLQVEGAIHEPVFKYRVTVGHTVATGCGLSKKKAKHSAAQAVLTKLRGAEEMVVAQYDDGIKGNPVGMLQELCRARRMPTPVYGEHQEAGRPHQRSFTVQCSVGEGKHEAVGVGKNKKMAKRHAANLMIKKLGEVPVDSEEAPESIDDDDLVEGESDDSDVDIIEADRSTTKKPSKRFSQLHKNLKCYKGKYLEKLRGRNLKSETDLNSVKMLERISKEQGFGVTYVDVEEVSKSGLNQCMVQLSTIPLGLCFGHGSNRGLAKQAAARDALDYIQLMIK